MGRRLTYRRRSRRRPTRGQRQQRRKTQYRDTRRRQQRRQRGGVSSTIATEDTLDGMPYARGAVITRGGVAMTIPEFIERQEKGDIDPSLD